MDGSFQIKFYQNNKNCNIDFEINTVIFEKKEDTRVVFINIVK